MTYEFRKAKAIRFQMRGNGCVWCDDKKKMAQAYRKIAKDFAISFVYERGGIRYYVCEPRRDGTVFYNKKEF